MTFVFDVRINTRPADPSEYQVRRVTIESETRYDAIAKVWGMLSSIARVEPVPSVEMREVPGPHPERPAKGDDWDGDCG